MAASYLLGFDVGTYESKGTICDFEGNIQATASNRHQLRTPQPGFAEHDPIEDWWKDFKIIIQQLFEKTGLGPADIAAVGISAIMAAITPVDEHGNPLRNAILYGIDTRCIDQAKEINDKVGMERMIERFGGPCSVEHYGPKILWIRQNEPEIYAKTKYFTIASGFLTSKLTGQYRVDRYSIKSSVPMVDPKTLQWDDEMCELVCPKEMLPTLAEVCEVIGTITPEAAADIGLLAGTPVICGTTDAAAEAVSVGVVDDHDTMFMYGSTFFFIHLDRVRATHSGLWMGDYVFKEFCAYTGGMATTGSLTRWILDNFAKELVEQAAAGKINAFDTLFAEAETVPPGSDGLVCLPYFLGERMPIQDPKARGVFFGLNLRHTRANVMRAAFEGTAFGIRQNVDIIRNAGIDVSDVIAVGGGTKTPLWMQIVSDICNVRQTIPEVTVGASYGDALMAGIGIGAITSPSDIKRMIKVKYVTEPNPENAALYETNRKVFNELYERNKDLMHLL